MSTYGCPENRRSGKGFTVTISATTAHASSLSAAPHAEKQEWLTGDGCAELVIGFLRGQGWSVVSDDLANVHCASPDGRAYVGFLPETPDAFHHDVLWRVSVSAPRGGRGWKQSFGSGTPAEAIAGFLTALIAAQAQTEA